MATKQLTIGSSVGNGGIWSNLPNMYDGSTGTAGSNSGGTATAEFYNFSDLDDIANSDLGDPSTVIDYFLIEIEAQKTSGPDARLQCYLEEDGSPYSQEYSVPITSASYTTLQVKIPAKVNGQHLSRKEIRESVDLRLILSSTDASTVFNIRELRVIIYYTTGDYLRGETSTFPYATDTISEVTNSSATTLVEADVITADQINRLGDAIISVQRVLDLDQDIISKIRGSSITIGKNINDIPEVFIFSFVLRGTTPPDFYSKFFLEESAVTLINQDYSGSFLTSDFVDPSPQTRIVFPCLTAMGWVDNGTNLPLHVSPQVSAFVDTGTIISTSVGFRVFPGLGAGFSTDFTSTTSPLFNPYVHSSYVGAYNFEIRMLGFGVAL